ISGDNIPNGTNFTTGTTKIIGAGVGSTIVQPSGGHAIQFFSFRQYIEFQNIEVAFVGVNGGSIGTNGMWIDSANSVRFKNMRVHPTNGENIFTTPSASNLEFINVESDHAGVNRNGNGACPDNACAAGGGMCRGYCHGTYIESTNVTFDSCSMHDNNGIGFSLYPSPNGVII